MNTTHDFRVKILNRGPVQDQEIADDPRVEVIRGTNFMEYHRAFDGVYALLTLTSKTKQSSYYENQLTSSINYCRAYNLRVVIDQGLQDIYRLDNAFVYPGTDIVSAFEQCLNL